jgi:taurine dioxygenase
MSIETRPLTDHFGVEAMGVDLAAPMTDATFEALRRAFVDAGVMLIRNQDHLTPADQVRFSARFGPLESHVLGQFTLPGQPEIFVVSNIVEDGRHIGAHGGSKQYHSDLAYLAAPSLGSIFRCLECPKEGGETAFISMAAAYDALPGNIRMRLETLSAEYDYAWGYDQRHAKTRGPLSAEQRAKTPPIAHPAVIAHPETGRPALFLSDIWIRRFGGLSEAETEALLDAVMAIAAAPDAEYRHQWQPGDVVLWDNRSTMHKACPFDETNTRRLMHRTTIQGTPPVRFDG